MGPLCVSFTKERSYCSFRADACVARPLLQSSVSLMKKYLKAGGGRGGGVARDSRELRGQSGLMVAI